MSTWAAKRFWKSAQTVAAEGGWTVHLDDRAVRTPARAPLIVPTKAMAREIALEWGAQEGLVKPETMPFTRSANAAIDKVAVQFDEVAALISAYGGTDLMCYRAQAPAELAARQAAGWDALLDWAAQDLGAPLCVVQGVMPVAQQAASLARLHERVAGFSPFELAALHDLVAMSGSLILGLAVCHGRLPPSQAWELSRIDETWQSELWGEDDEAVQTATLKQAAFVHAARFYAAARDFG